MHLTNLVGLFMSLAKRLLIYALEDCIFYGGFNDGLRPATI